MTDKRGAGPALTVVLAAAVVAALAIGGFLLFREEPWDESVIAYVGETAITESEVDGVIEQLRAARVAEAERLVGRISGNPSPAEQEAFLAQQLADIEERLVADRGRVIEMRILTEAGRRYAGGAGWPVPEPEPTIVAEETGLPADHPYTRVVAEFYAVIGMLESRAGPDVPTGADQREVYDHLVAEDLTDASFAEAQEVLTADVLAEPVGLRNLLTEVVADSDIRINPRYEPVYRVRVPMGEGSSWLGVPLTPPEQE